MIGRTNRSNLGFHEFTHHRGKESYPGTACKDRRKSRARPQKGGRKQK